MKTLCAWCGKVMKDDGNDSETVSHGICESCAIKCAAGENITDKPTPRPWIVKNRDWITGSNQRIAVCDEPNSKTQTKEANAALIVKAVNCHDMFWDLLHSIADHSTDQIAKTKAKIAIKTAKGK